MSDDSPFNISGWKRRLKLELKIVEHESSLQTKSTVTSDHIGEESFDGESKTNICSFNAIEACCALESTSTIARLYVNIVVCAFDHESRWKWDEIRHAFVPP